jgi:hypothetical protein
MKSTIIQDIGFPTCNPSATCGSIQYQLINSFYTKGNMWYGTGDSFFTHLEGSWFYSLMVFGRNSRFTFCLPVAAFGFEHCAFGIAMPKNPKAFYLKKRKLGGKCASRLGSVCL